MTIPKSVFAMIVDVQERTTETVWFTRHGGAT